MFFTFSQVDNDSNDINDTFFIFLFRNDDEDNFVDDKVDGNDNNLMLDVNGLT